MAKTLYIIDGHAHIYAAYYAPMSRQLTSPAGEPTKATYIFTTALLGLIQKRKPDMLAVAMDSKGPTFRNEIYARYKAQRPPMPDDMPTQINRIEEILEAMKIPMLRVEGYEADDIIGTLAKKAASQGCEVYICATDKDVLQLIDRNINVYDMRKDKVTDLKILKQEKGITPQQVVDCLILEGDTSDNIPGIPDVGPKTALNWIHKFGSVENLYKNADRIKGKRGKNLRKFRDNLPLSRKLMTINCDVPLNIDYEKLKLTQFDEKKLEKLFTELGFNRLLTKLNLPQQPSRQQIPEEKIPTRPSINETASAGTTKHHYSLIDTTEKFHDFLEELKKQKLFAFDTETTSVFAMKADLVGMSFCWKEQYAFYLPVRTTLGEKNLDSKMLIEKLGPVMADQNIRKIGQNIKYDMLVMKNAGIPVKGIYFDTMIASYCLDPLRNSHSIDKMAKDFLNYECVPISDLIGKGKNQLTFDMVDTAAACEYAAEDADITFQLYEYFKTRLDNQPDIKELFEKVEMPLVTVLARMEFNGVSLDVGVLKKMSGEITEQLEQLSNRIYEYAGSVFNIDSPKQLAEILFDRLKLKSTKIGKAGRSTDAAVLEKLSGEHPVIPLIVHYRMLSKLKNTYVDKLGTLINPRTGRVHTSFNQTVTATGRLSSSDPNLQNIPIRTEIGRKVRSAFVTGNITDCILSADYSQVELRLLAHFSKDRELMKAFEEDRDIHRFVAAQIYNLPIEEVTSGMRSNCKAVNFGIIYGQGPYGLAQTTGLTRTEAAKFIDNYFARYSSIKKFMKSCIDSAKKNGYARTIMNRRRKIPNLKSTNDAKRSQAERLAVNTVIQGSAADLIKMAMINIHRKIEKEKLPVKLILQVHDELVFELPEKQVLEHKKWITKEMTQAVRLDVPLKVDVTYGKNWLTEK